MKAETKCSCQHCGGHIGFERQQGGQTAACPHCGLDTTLYVPAEPAQQTSRLLRTRRRLALIVCAVIGGCALLAALVAGIAGRKPKETALTGQIFIATKGAESVKLGGVELLLIKKQRVVDFLRERQPAIDAEIKTRQLAAEDASAAVADANSNLVIAQAEYDKCNKKQAGDSTTDQNTELNTEDKLDLMREEFEWQQRIANLRGQTAVQAVQAEIAEKQKEVAVLDKAAAEAEKIRNAAVAVKEAAEHRVDALKASLTAHANLVAYLTAGDFMEGFAAPPFKKAVTDADGRFSITYPRRKAFTLYAKSERLVAKSTEHYCWLVDALTNSASERIILSNGNLTPVDLGGYFEHKLHPDEP